MIGKPGSSVLVTLAERRTCYSIIAKAHDKSAQAVTDALLTALQPHADLLVHTLTYENGKEFAYHQTVAKGLDAQGYLPTPTIPGSADSTRTPTDSPVSICPRAPISGLSHLRRSAASWTGSTTGHGNVLASRLQISYSQKSIHLLYLRVESANYATA